MVRFERHDGRPRAPRPRGCGDLGARVRGDADGPRRRVAASSHRPPLPRGCGARPVAAASARGLVRPRRGRAHPLRGPVPLAVLRHRPRHAARSGRHRHPYPGALHHPVRRAPPRRAAVVPAVGGNGARLRGPRNDRVDRRSRPHRHRSLPHGPRRHELRPGQRAPQAAAAHGHARPRGLAEPGAAAARPGAVRPPRRPARLGHHARRGDVA